MTDTKFWQLLALIDRSQIGEALDDDAALAPLVEALALEPEAEIRAFHDHLARVLYRLDGELFADEAGESKDSNDGFLYARCFVVAQGRTHYDAVLAQPSKMPKTVDGWFEALLSAPHKAWEQRTGEQWEYEPEVSWETGSNTTAWS
jgi:hypothetical protein